LYADILLQIFPQFSASATQAAATAATELGPEGKLNSNALDRMGPLQYPGKSLKHTNKQRKTAKISDLQTKSWAFGLKAMMIAVECIHLGQQQEAWVYIEGSGRSWWGSPFGDCHIFMFICAPIWYST